MAAGEVVHDGIRRVSHKRLTGAQLHLPFPYIQAADPGAVGAGVWWYKNTTNQLYVRDSTNTSWTLVNGGGAPTGATYITQTPDAGLSAEQALSGIATGIMKNTTGTGVVSIATAGTDYTTPTGTENLQNKTLNNTNTVTLKDTLFMLQDDGDTSKQAQFQASGITTATTRTYTLPNASERLSLLNLGYQGVIGPKRTSATNTSLASGQSLARVLGYTTSDITSVEVIVNVSTAAVTITWAEVGLASGASATSGSLTRITTQSVSASFNSTGVKTLTFSVNIAAGTWLYFLAGSQATTPFQLNATLGDPYSSGVIRLATDRPSTMASPTTFTSSTATTGAVDYMFRWS